MKYYVVISEGVQDIQLNGIFDNYENAKKRVRGIVEDDYKASGLDLNEYIDYIGYNKNLITTFDDLVDAVSLHIMEIDLNQTINADIDVINLGW